MPNQPFVVRLHYYLPKGQGLNGLQSAAHHIEYMGSVKKDELLAAESGTAEHDHTTLESAAIHSRYAGEREGSMGYFGSRAGDPKAAQDSILKAKGPVWRVIASVGESDALAMGGDLTTKSGWSKAANAVVPQMIKQLGLDSMKVQWIAAAHRHQKHENNPHIHLLIWESGQPSRKTAKWSDAERRAVRKDWITELYRPERQRLGIEKSEARTEARTAIVDLIAHRNDQQGFNRELSSRLSVLGGMLPGQGRLAYGYMPPPVKAEVERTVRWLWSVDPSLKAAHDRFLKTAEELGTAYWHRDPGKTQDTPGRQQAIDRIKVNAEADLIKRLAGPILQASRKQVRSTERDEYREASQSARSFLRDESQAARRKAWVERFQAEGPSDDALKGLVVESREWVEREQWIAGWLAEGELSETAHTTGLRAWDTVVQSVIQNEARLRQREDLAREWAIGLDPEVYPDRAEQLWDIAKEYASSGRTTTDWKDALNAYAAVIPGLQRFGGDELTAQKFERHLAHRVGWLDQHQAVANTVSDADLRRFRRDPDAVIDRAIRESPEIQTSWRSAGHEFFLQQPYTYRYAKEAAAPNEWEFSERTFTERGGPLLQASFDAIEKTPSDEYTFSFPFKVPPGIQASVFDPNAHRIAQDEARTALRERVSKHITSIGYERGVYRRVSGPDLVGALHHLILKAERDARLTAIWMAEAEFQRKKAEAAIAQSTGQQLSQ